MSHSSMPFKLNRDHGINLNCVSLWIQSGFIVTWFLNPSIKSFKEKCMESWWPRGLIAMIESTEEGKKFWLKINWKIYFKLYIPTIVLYLYFSLIDIHTQIKQINVQLKKMLKGENDWFLNSLYFSITI